MNVEAPDNAAAVAIATTLLGIAALFQIFDASQATLANMLRGVHDSRVPLLIALLGYWAIGAPVGVTLAFLTPLGAVGIWIGLATRPRRRRYPSVAALGRQGAAKPCGLTLGPPRRRQGEGTGEV